MLRWILVVVITASAAGFLGPGAANAALGDSAADLVYTLVTQCTVVNTTMSLGGPIIPGFPQNFVVNGSVGFENQGGNPGGCGVPAGATAAVLNLVAVKPGGPGDLRVWAFGLPEPADGLIFFDAAVGLNLANGAVVALCDPASAACQFAISVDADTSASDLIVDVIGYLQSTAPRQTSIGKGNTFLGVNAGNFTTVGANTATGANALSSNTTGNNNTATGFNALHANTTGCCNTANGNNALLSNTTGSSNTASGDGALFSNSTGVSNTAIGRFALISNTNGNNNTATGVGALQSNCSSPCSQFEGGNNTATGVSALLNNTTGANNTASGFSALQGNTTGSSNTASGDGALFSNSAGNNNTAVGRFALHQTGSTPGTNPGNNTALGVSALQSNTIGTSNTASGLNALRSNTTGFSNTASGVSALVNNINGIFNTAIGAFADVSLENLVNATAIGSGAVVNASNKIRLGDSRVTVVEGPPYSTVSDRNQKENFRPVDAEEVLSKIRGLSVTSWNYIGHDPKQFRHYGPVGQDFFAAFGHDSIGTIGSPTTISSVDMAGILMIAVQALEKRTTEQKTEFDALRTENAGLRAENADLKARIEALERVASGMRTAWGEDR